MENPQYAVTHNGEGRVATEEEFTAFYDAFGKATVISFAPINAGNSN